MHEFLKSLLTDNVKTLTEIASTLLLLGGGFLISKIKELKEILKKKRNHEIQHDPEVKDKVVELRVLTEANRAFVFQRHNGVQYNSGQGMDKVTMTYEVCDGATRQTIAESKSMELYLFREKVTLCDETGFIVLVTEELGEEDSYLKDLLVSRGVQICILVPFKRSRLTTPEGYVGITYTYIDEEEYAEEKENILTIVKSYSSEIGFLLRN